MRSPSRSAAQVGTAPPADTEVPDVALFGRRNRGIEVEIDEVTDEDIDSFVDDLDDHQRAAEDAELLRELAQDEELTAEAPSEVPELSRPQGPWDLQDA